MVLLLDVFALLTAARCATQLPAPALIVRTRTSIVVHAFIARPHAQSREHDSKLNTRAAVQTKPKIRTPTRQTAEKTRPEPTRGMQANSGMHTPKRGKNRAESQQSQAHRAMQTRQKSRSNSKKYVATRNRTHTLVLRALASLP
jgi:hypothetical protein